jgi:hypothetical protein
MREDRFAPWVWIPLLLGIGALGLTLLASAMPKLEELGWIGVPLFAAIYLYFIVQGIARLIKKRWRGAIYAFLRLALLTVLAFLALGMMFAMSFFGPSEDHFADNLTIPEGLDIAEPVPDVRELSPGIGTEEVDELQTAIHSAIMSTGSEDPSFAPAIPSLSQAATDHPKAFRDYIEASPDWHVFLERGNRFASRRWSYRGEPRDTLHGYISEFDGDAGFQTRCLLCLDRKQWSRYRVQHVKEGPHLVKPDMTLGNSLHESRVMIECSGVWLEIFEQSGKPERRVTKATVTTLEKEFSKFNTSPQAAVARAQDRSRDLARRLASTDGQPFRLLEGMQPGIYGIAYSLNPGEPGVVYLKAFEVTQGTSLSDDRLRGASETRMSWSKNPADLFGAKAGFTIYEGDWGKPYAARFEVWFQPDSGKPARKLAQRIFKIEGWQR